MSLRFLLDTNIVSDLVRNPQGKVAAKIVKVGEDSIATSIIVASELHYGAAKKGSVRLSKQLEVVLVAMLVLPFEAPADVRYGDLRVALEKAGKPIGANDLLIAAHALALDLVLVTANAREFRRVRGLKVENWVA